MTREFTIYSAPGCKEDDIENLRKVIEKARKDPTYTMFVNYYVEVQVFPIPDGDDNAGVQFPLFIIGSEAEEQEVDKLRDDYTKALTDGTDYLATHLHIEVVQR